MRSRVTVKIMALACAGIVFSGVAGPSAAQAQLTSPVGPVTTPGAQATLLPDGSASIPAAAPKRVRKAINAANRIRTRPYLWGGGHRSFDAAGYDCSGAVSYVLHAAGVLKRPISSGPMSRWGEGGHGRWITAFANRQHAYVVVAGLRFDTSSAGDPSGSGKGPRWRSTKRSSKGYKKRHDPRV